MVFQLFIALSKSAYLLATTFGFLLFSFGLIQNAYSHFEHFTHYNNSGDEIGKYFVYQEVIPEYARPGESTKIMFSIQDGNNNDISSIKAMIEIYTSAGRLLQVFPWKVYDTGDFQVNYTFQQEGTYQIVLSIANNRNAIEKVPDVRRNILTETSMCDCERGVFNVSVSKNFGSVYNPTLVLAVVLPLAILGIVLGVNYTGQKKHLQANTIEKRNFLKYIIMLLALAGGIVHLAVYSEHASLRLEYSIFLLAAGGAQIAYGSLYIFTTLEYKINKNTRTKLNLLNYYNKTVVINLFGLIGTLVLVGLYSYTILFPPPLSPNNESEKIEAAGVIAKTIEILLIVGIIYLMKWEKSQKNTELLQMQE